MKEEQQLERLDDDHSQGRPPEQLLWQRGSCGANQHLRHPQSQLRMQLLALHHKWRGLDSCLRMQKHRRTISISCKVVLDRIGRRQIPTFGTGHSNFLNNASQIIHIANKRHMYTYQRKQPLATAHAMAHIDALQPMLTQCRNNGSVTAAAN